MGSLAALLREAGHEVSGSDQDVFPPMSTFVEGLGLPVSWRLDPANLPEADKSKMNFGSGGNMEKKAWKDIWGAGQGVGQIQDVKPVADVVAQLKREYEEARRRLG